MKKILVFCFLLSSLYCYGQENPDLLNYIRIVQENYSGLAPLRESVTNSEVKIDQSKSGYYPQLNITGSYTRMSLFSEISFPFNGQMMNLKFGTPNNYNSRITLSQQVFNWGRTEKSVELAKHGLDMTYINIDQTKFLLSYQVIPLYYGMIYMQEALKIMETHSALYERKLKILKTRFNQGLASDLDISLIEFQINSIKSQIEDLKNNMTKTKLAYNRLANRENNTEFNPSGKLEYIPFAQNGKSLSDEAEDNRIEFLQYRQQEELARTQIGLSETGNKPSLNFAFNYEFRNGFMPDMDKIKGNWTAALSFSYPLFDGFKTKYSVEEGESNLRIINARRTDFKQGVLFEIEQALSDIATAQSKIKIETDKISYSEKALKIAEERYSSGLISGTDLIESQNNYANAKLNYLQLVYNHILNKYNVYRLTGKKLN